MNQEENKKGLFQKKNIVGFSFILIVFLATLLYFAFLREKSNDVFTDEFRKSILDTRWVRSIPITDNDFEIIYEKLQNVSLKETKEIDRSSVPIPSFDIIIKTDDNMYSVTVFEKYIEVQSNYYIGGQMLGKGKSKATYYKASKDFTKDKELMNVFFKYVNISSEKKKEDAENYKKY